MIWRLPTKVFGWTKGTPHGLRRIRPLHLFSRASFGRPGTSRPQMLSAAESATGLAKLVPILEEANLSIAIITGSAGLVGSKPSLILHR